MQTEHRGNDWLGVRGHFLAASVATIVAVGCAGTDESLPNTSWAEGVAEESIAEQVVPPDMVLAPDATRFDIKRVTARGTGCPAGEWAIEPKGRSPDGKISGFTMTFNKYTLEMDPAMAPVMTKNCGIVVPIISPMYLQYAVTKFIYRGFAYLEQDVTLNFSADYTFAGTLAVANPGRVVEERKGPLSDIIIFEDDVKARNPGLALGNWSACSTEASIIIDTRMTIVNSIPRRTGTVSVHAVDAIAGKLEVDVDTRPCPIPGR